MAHAESGSTRPADPGPEVGDEVEAPLVETPVARGPILARLAVCLVGVLTGIALVDLAVSWWDRGRKAEGSSVIAPYEPLGWNNRPHFVNPEFGTELDRYGLRNREIGLDAPPDELRIAGFGASRLYGAGGAQQAWVWNHQLEQELAPLVSPPPRVLNGGVMGYSTLRACRRAGLLLDAVEPDLVFVLVSPGAQLLLDPTGLDAWVRFGDGPDDLMPADVALGWPEIAHPIVGPAHRFLVRRSGIYQRMRARFQTAGEADAKLQKWMLTRGEQPPSVQAMIDATVVEACTLARLCAERRIRLVFVALPEMFQCNEKVWEHHLREHRPAGAPPVGTPRREPLEALEDLFRAAGLEVWTFWDEVDLMGRERLKYVVSRSDNHWTKAGHEVFARGLRERLVADGLLTELAQQRRAAPRERAFGPSPFAELDIGAAPARATAAGRGGGS